jgi:hypothetical protein
VVKEWPFRRVQTLHPDTIEAYCRAVEALGTTLAAGIERAGDLCSRFVRMLAHRKRYCELGPTAKAAAEENMVERSSQQRTAITPASYSL